MPKKHTTFYQWSANIDKMTSVSFFFSKLKYRIMTNVKTKCHHKMWFLRKKMFAWKSVWSHLQCVMMHLWIYRFHTRILSQPPRDISHQPFSNIKFSNSGKKDVSISISQREKNHNVIKKDNVSMQHLDNIKNVNSRIHNLIFFR